ncbi:MAG: DUF4254 domain-containing protein [Tannerellaceae bacterium]|jgi:hypothetical protein|nr:DUF4254 domain-containing protein [Tannerellaceae bacterium]
MINDNRIEKWVRIFEEATEEYHRMNSVDVEVKNPYGKGSLELMLFRKNYIDAVQWHLEDIIRNPRIIPEEALIIKRRIDRSNQERTDIVEQIDDYLRDLYKDVKVLPEATLNTESPAWAMDRLSILILKVYHMRQEVNRSDVPVEHRERCAAKLEVLLEQKADLCEAINQLFTDITTGHCRMKVYKQMKMYNDPSLNPVLYCYGQSVTHTAIGHR